MKKENDIQVLRTAGNQVFVSFRNHGNLSLLRHGFIRFSLKESIMNHGTRLIMDLTGIKFIDSESFDTLNLLSRLARKYNSSIWLKGVEPEALELIELAKKYSVFDIQHVEPLKEEVI